MYPQSLLSVCFSIFRNLRKKVSVFFDIKDRERISKISEIGKYKERRPQAVSSLLSLTAYIFNTLYIRNFCFVILSIFSISFMYLVYLLIRLISLYLLYLVHAFLSILFHHLLFLLISPLYTQIVSRLQIHPTLC